jgi:hypothetical protein
MERGDMIIQITHPAKLQGVIATEFVKCMERYCEKAKDGVSVEDLAEIIDQRVFGNRTASLFLGFGKGARVQAFAIVRKVTDFGVGDALDLWHVYVDLKAPPGLLAEGLQTFKEYAKAGRLPRLQFCSHRGVDSGAWAKVLKGHGFSERAVIYESEVADDGKPENRPG